MHDTDTQLRTLAAAQHGLATVGQAGQLGLGTREINHRLSIGMIERVSPRVLRIAGAPATERQALMATVLQAGRCAAVSHSTALAFWGVRGFVLDPIHVVRHRDIGDSTVQGATVHEVRSLPSDLVRTSTASRWWPPRSRCSSSPACPRCRSGRWRGRSTRPGPTAS